jgi:hypothetical protein
MNTCVRQKPRQSRRRKKYSTRRVLALPERGCGGRMLRRKMMRCGSRMITEKLSRKGSEKDRRGIINEAAGTAARRFRRLWEIVTDGRKCTEPD